MISSWLTPSYLFIFVNLVIATIAITSRFANSHAQKHHNHQLHRPPSFLNRVMSFNLSCYKHEPTLNPVQTQDPPQAQRISSLSLLDRVSSNKDKDEKTQNQIKRVTSNKDKNENQVISNEGENENIETQVSSLVLLDHKTMSNKNEDQKMEYQVPSSSLLDRVTTEKEKKIEASEADVKDLNLPQKLKRPPSLLERLKSVTLFRSESRKELEPGSEEEREEEEEVDAKADDFINKFREQLRLQRLDSILRYRHVLKRY